MKENKVKNTNHIYGNKYGEKYKTTKERQEVYNKFCKHVASGLSLDCFPECSENTMRKMMIDYKEELSSDLLLQAKRQAKTMLEKMGLGGASGHLRGFNSRAWEFIMMNKFGLSLRVVNDNFNHEKEEFKKEIENKELEIKEEIDKDVI